MSDIEDTRILPGSDVNPRAVIGGNNPPFAQIISEIEDAAAGVTAFLGEQYASFDQELAELLDEARALPPETNTDDRALANGAVIKKLKDLDRKFEATREREKQPYLRGGNAVDTHFNTRRDKIGRRNRNAAAGAIDVLQQRNDGHMQRKLADEQARRDREAAEAARAAREAREKAEREQRQADEARAAAERARKPEHIEQKSSAASAAEEQAAVATSAAVVAAERAQEAHIDTLAKPADLVRTRGDDGVLLTMAKENYAIVKDRAKLDYVKLAPFFTDNEIEKALRGWAKTTGFAQQMDGAEIGKKNRSVTR